MLRGRWLGRGSKGLKKRAQRARLRCEGGSLLLGAKGGFIFLPSGISFFRKWRKAACMPAGRGPLFSCHRCHGQDDEGHAEEIPETEGEAEDEEGEKDG